MGVDDAAGHVLVHQGSLSLRLRAHTTSASKLTIGQRASRTDHDLPDVSSRKLTNEDRTEENQSQAATKHGDHASIDRHHPTRIHGLQTYRILRHTHVQHSCARYAGRSVGGLGC